MNILVDECVASEIVERLRRDGHDVIFAGDANAGDADDDVLTRAAASNRILLTADKDFGELVYRMGRAHAGVVLLRLAGVSLESRTEVVSALFRDRAREITNSFTVIEPNTIRIRHTP